MRPCRGRKLSDTHAQVGPGQSFTLKWATGLLAGLARPRPYARVNGGTHEHRTANCQLSPHATPAPPQRPATASRPASPALRPAGHTRNSYIVAIKAEDEAWLRDDRFVEYIEEYLTEAPSSSHLEPKWKRYHGA